MGGQTVYKNIVGQDPETLHLYSDDAAGRQTTRTSLPPPPPPKETPVPEEYWAGGEAWSPDEQRVRDARDAIYQKRPLLRYTDPIDINDPEYQRSVLEPHYGQSIPGLGVEPQVVEGPRLNRFASRRKDSAVAPAVAPVALSGSEDGVPTRPTDPSTGVPPEMAPPESPGMASIRGKLGTLQKQIALQAGRQAKEYDDVEKQYKEERDRVEEQTQVDNARRKTRVAEGALNTAVEKLSTWEINPSRAFPNAFSKIAAVLGVSMGAYSQGLSGGKLPNTALQIVNSAIDRDIEAQKADFQKLKGMVDEKRNIYGMAMRMLGDERQADELARSAAYRAFNAGVTSMSKQFGLTNQQNAQAIQALGLEERENFHSAQLTRMAGKGSGELSDKTRKEFGDLQSLRNQITSYRELHQKRNPLDIVGQHMGFFGATDGVQIEQKRGLIARQLLMYTDSGRISDHNPDWLFPQEVPSN